MGIDRRQAGATAAELEELLDREYGEPGLPSSLAERYRAAVRILRDAADPDTAEADAEKALDVALRQLQTPPMVFLPHGLTRGLESIRMHVDRARRA